MSKLSRLCLVAVVSFFAAGAAFAQQAPTQESQQQRQVTQPGNNAPVWRDVRKEGQKHTTTVKGRETEVLVQSWGDTWRRIRNGPVTFWGGWLVVIVVLILAALYFAKGPVKVHDKPSGRLIHRFTPVEQVKRKPSPPQAQSMRARSAS